MKVLVLLKQVPRLRSDTPVGDDGRWIDLEKTKYDPNSYDLFALEAALQLVEAAGDDAGEVVVVSAGPKRVKEAIKTALEIGAHRAIHLCDESFESCDAGTLARSLAVVCERESPDLVLAGFMSDDGNAAATGPMLAEYSGMASATGVVSIEPIDDGFRVLRELEAGAFDLVDLVGPSVVTVQTGINEVRYPSLKAIVAARKKTIEVLEQDASGAGTAVGTMIEALVPAASDGAVTLLEGSNDEIVAALVSKLDELRVI